MAKFWQVHWIVSFNEARSELESPLVRGRQKITPTTSYFPHTGGILLTRAKAQPRVIKNGGNSTICDQSGGSTLTYRGKRYFLKDRIVNVNLAGKPGVPLD